MNTTRTIAIYIAMAIMSLAVCSSQAAKTAVTSTMVGHWEGDARIIVSWCRQTNLHVSVDIRADGSVTGKVGDTTLLNGRFERNRGWLGRKLNLATDYIIKGKLSGPIVTSEGITRDRVSIPLNFTGGAFAGGIHTSGSKFGGKEKMILSAHSLTLTHSE